MVSIDKWIEHLQHPLVLVGFALFVVASLVRWLKPEKLSGVAIERLFGRGLSYVFILSLIVIISGIYISLPVTGTSTQTQQQSIIQQTSGGSSPAISSNRNVNISYGNSSKENEQEPAEKKHAELGPVAMPNVVEQTSTGDKSPVINSKGDVSISYGK